MNTFIGIPASAVEFYAALESNNNKLWWLEHKDTYDAEVRLPLQALADTLEARFGAAKLFRPYRDVRFGPDKTPYKTAQGMFLSNYEGVGFYLQLSADGLLIGGGYHSFAPAQLSRYRAAVDATVSGKVLMSILAGLSESGFSIEGQTLKTVPRGFPKDHGRAELLKHKTLSASMALGIPDWLESEEMAGEITDHWEQLRPLVDWVVRYAAP
ncbi:DUF2461 domain-containing protein [Arthrobacter glacialis]|uniref:TIGR02453 family protein n=1 Tax=Arthrobacter glacialis TaxID=1664 RepID=A0A2S3ZY95_ARTGL|nr:DUF2461 domain-containing protein [Arthrobacter glacialis]POH74255.1 TIGR02453 family protein [Arthrobacter glacialis]